MKKAELLAPAGDLEKLKTAVDYGADAVYLGGGKFSLRAAAGSFSPEELAEGVKYAHDRGRKVYLTVNIFAHNDDIAGFREYIRSLGDVNIDAFLVSDPGLMMMLKELRPEAEIHLSTQANTTNYMSAKFWYDMGIKRIVAARELSLEELRELRANIPDDMEIEVFVHGAMCISYSGRCLMSNFMASRDANRGACAHPCRWKYALVEEKRPGEYYSVDGDERGTYFFNSKDLCLIEYIPELVSAGITSFKIEGRMKSAFYAATVVRAYRAAIDSYFSDPDGYVFRREWLDEVSKVSNRHFTAGFFIGRPDGSAQNFESGAYIRDYEFIGVVRDYDPVSGEATVEQRNNFKTGDEIEVFGPENDGFFTMTIDSMTDDTGVSIDTAPHAQQIVRMKMKEPAGKNYMLRRRKV